MATYSVLGMDGVSYGPVDEATLGTWAREGRINAQTILHCMETGQRLMPQQVTSLAPFVGIAQPVVQVLAQPPYLPPQYAIPHYVQPIAPVYYAQPIYQANRKDVGVAYLLWFFAGGLGAHRFYLGHTGSAIAILLLTIFSVLLAFVLIGIVTIWIPIIWCIVDLFLIPGMVTQHNNSMGRY